MAYIFGETVTSQSPIRAVMCGRRSLRELLMFLRFHKPLI